MQLPSEASMNVETGQCSRPTNIVQTESNPVYGPILSNMDYIPPSPLNMDYAPPIVQVDEFMSNETLWHASISS